MLNPDSAADPVKLHFDLYLTQSDLEDLICIAFSDDAGYLNIPKDHINFTELVAKTCTPEGYKILKTALEGELDRHLIAYYMRINPYNKPRGKTNYVNQN